MRRTTWGPFQEAGIGASAARAVGLLVASMRQQHDVGKTDLTRSAEHPTGLIMPSSGLTGPIRDSTNDLHPTSKNESPSRKDITLSD